MHEHFLPTEEELDALLDCGVEFDLDAVKRRTRQRISQSSAAPVRRKVPLRGLLIAAMVCTLSVTAFAGVTGTPLRRMLGLPTEEPIQAPPPKAEQVQPSPAVQPPPPQPEPEPAPAPESASEPPVINKQLTDALALTPAQQENLRGSAQEVQKTAAHKDVKMTVLQTLGDESILYLTVRFDFPQEIPLSEGLEFKDIDISVEDVASMGFSHEVIERTISSVTYLLQCRSAGEDLRGRTFTLSFSDYGQPLQEEDDHHTMFQAQAPRTLILLPGKNINASASAEDVSSLASPAAYSETTSDGFTLTHLDDGTIVVDYDGLHGLRYISVYYDDEMPRVRVGDDPTFQTLLEGEWEQSWQLEYEVSSASWSGREESFFDTAALTSFRVTPFSWEGTFEGVDIVPVALAVRDFGDFQILSEDGSLHPIATLGRSCSDHASGTHLCMRVWFSAPIDLSHVSALVIGGVEFPLS